MSVAAHPRPDQHNEHDDSDEFHGRILWGRVVVFALLLPLLAFWLGRMTATGVPEADLEQAQERARQLQSTNTDLEAEVARLSAQQTGGTSATAPSGETTNDVQAPAAGRPRQAPDGRDENARTYRVRQGDTLAGIAQRVYGDALEWKAIARANDLSADKPEIVVGQVLKIPAE